MFNVFHPTYTGTHKPKSLSSDFITNLAKRIRSPGLFPPASKRRNRYEIVEQKQDSLRFRSVSFLTSIHIGLNDVTTRTDRKTGEIRYDVSYWTWAKYTLGLCFFIGLVLAFLFLSPLLRTPPLLARQIPYPDPHHSRRYPPYRLLGTGLVLASHPVPQKSIGQATEAHTRRSKRLNNTKRPNK